METPPFGQILFESFKTADTYNPDLAAEIPSRQNFGNISDWRKCSAFVSIACFPQLWNFKIGKNAVDKAGNFIYTERSSR